MKGDRERGAGKDGRGATDARDGIGTLQGTFDAAPARPTDRRGRQAAETERDHLITRQVFNASNDGIWAIDGDRRILRINRKLLGLLGREGEDVVGRTCTDILPGGCPRRSQCPWARIREGAPVVEQEASLAAPSGERLVFRVTATPLADLGGGVIGLVETFSDITAIKRAEAALQQANHELAIRATEDVLTKIANRRRFDDYLEAEWRRQKRARKPIALAMCDVDRFKAYNDLYGHQAGDACLRTVAGVIRDSMFRAGDLCARFGGDEFAVILPETGTNGARCVVDRMRRRIEEARVPHAGSDAAPVVTISCGAVSVVPGGAAGPDALIREADRRLYRAKQDGRNRFVCGGED